MGPVAHRHARATDAVLDQLMVRHEIRFEQALALDGDRLQRLPKTEIRPTLEAYTAWGFVEEPLNNSTLLGQMLYYHRLPDFEALLERNGGELRGALDAIANGVPGLSDPFELLPRSGPEVRPGVP